MKLKSIAAMALFVGASTFALNAFAADTSGGSKALPGNVGTEGHASNPAKTADDTPSTGSVGTAEPGDKMEKLPGNVGVEGHARDTASSPGSAADSAKTPMADDKQGMEKLPGNVGVEGHARDTGDTAIPKK